MVTSSKSLRGERDARRDAHRQRGGRALSDGRFDADGALDDVGGDVGLPAGERDALVLNVVGHDPILRGSVERLTPGRVLEHRVGHRIPRHHGRHLDRWL